MRKVWVIVGMAALLAAGPARAQFGAPMGGGFLTAPEVSSGAIGAGAANSAAQQQPCVQSATGRDGPRGLCLNTPSQPRR